MSILHTAKLVTALQPRYLSRFACTGQACEANCCTGWTVHIDKKTFNAYKSNSHPLLTDRMTTKVTRIQTQASDAAYGKIELEPETHQCPFMEERLCSIQREMGEDKLSDTCASYPRNSRSLHGRFEQSLTLSCPEAAQLALLEPDAMDFVEGKVVLRPDTVEHFPKRFGLTAAEMEDIRFFILNLLRNPNLALWQRLSVLGVFCEQLTAVIKPGQRRKTQDFLQEMGAMIDSGVIDSILAPMEPDYELQATVFAAIWQSKIQNRLTEREKALHTAIAIGLGADPVTHEATHERLVAHYKRGLNGLNEALAQTPFFMEHYIVNEVFNGGFPFARETPQEDYLKLITRYGVIRLMLAAQCGKTEQLPDGAQMARTVQIFSRQYQHDLQFTLKVNSILHHTGLSQLEKVFRFIRA